MVTPPRKGNVPRVEGWVAWHWGFPATNCIRARVLACKSDCLLVTTQSSGWFPVDYGDVYPCEGPA